MIIFLNGGSSVGKSTIARQVMRQSTRPFIYYSIDHLVNYWMDEKFISFGEENKNWFHHENILDGTGQPQTRIVDGPNALALHKDMIEALEVLIKKGYDLIIDEVLWKKEIFEHYLHALCCAKSVYLFHITCDLIECEKRERARPDRFLGLARGLYYQLNQKWPLYDLEIDTTYTSASQCAASLLQYLETHTKPAAFLQSIRQEITFQALQVDHFPFLYQWHQAEHIIAWWNDGEKWDYAKVETSYTAYLKYHKKKGAKHSPICGYVIYCAQHPMGYLHYYNMEEVKQGVEYLDTTRVKVAALEIMIGDSFYTKKNLAHYILELFLKEYIWPTFRACFVALHVNNVAAINAYQKAGFKIVNRLNDPPLYWMLIENPHTYTLQS